MRRAMETAKKLGMTDGDFAFIYIDVYNTNTSYYWTDDDDNLLFDTSNNSEEINVARKLLSHEFLCAPHFLFKPTLLATGKMQIPIK